MSVHGRTILGLPLLTMTPDRTKYTMRRGGSDAYQSLPYLTPPLLNDLVILDWSTKVYQPPDLGRDLPCATFTNHYHRDGGLGIDVSVGVEVRWCGNVVMVM